MIRYKNVLLSLVSRRVQLQHLAVSRALCTAHKENPKEPEDEQRKKEDMHDHFMKRALILRGSFENVQNKDKANYIDMIRVFTDKDHHRRNHVEFIYAALKNMEEFGVHKDLQVYKALIDVMPKGKFIPQNIYQAEFQHYPKQQQCIIDLLEQMEDNGKFCQQNVAFLITIVIFRLHT